MSIRAFHDHLDTCRQCREHPFHLCAEGHKLLLAAGKVVGVAPPKVAPPSSYTCQACGGTGRNPYHPSGACAGCGGTGFTHADV